MNVLILTGKFGMGHLSVAEALYEDIEATYKNVNVEIVDIVNYMFPTMNKTIYESFDFIASKCSSIYNIYCSFSNKKSSVPMKHMVSKKIEKLIEETSADLVLSTVPLASQFVSVYKKKTGSNIPLYTYITDVTIHEEWISPYTDFYFVGAKDTKKDLVLKGVNPYKVVVSGIPVKRCFKNEESLKKKLNDKLEILIMGGGLGLLPSGDTLLKKLSENENVHLTVITGKNEKLKNDIEEKFSNIDVVGYTKNVHDFMKKADLLITKSGGITTFEAINSQIPLFVIKPFLKQEVGNAQFIESENLGRVIWYDDSDIAKDILALAENSKIMESIKQNMRKMAEQWSQSCPLDIYNMEGGITC